MLAALILSAFLAGPEPATVQVEALKFDAKALEAAGTSEVKVTEAGAAVTYKGIPLRTLLDDRLKGANAMADLRGLADCVLLVRASDGYQVALSAAEVAMDEKGERFLIAFRRDGAPLEASQGPAKLIVPGDPKHVRWIRKIERIDLIRMPRRD